MSDFFNYIADFFSSGIYDFFGDLLVALLEWVVVLLLSTTKFCVSFGWGIVKVIIQDLNLSGSINSAWSGLPADVRFILVSFRIPEGINIIFSSFITRFILNLIPGL